MLRCAKQCLLVCLIALQLAAPFIHAHAYGYDSLKPQVFHLHSDEVSNANQDAKTFSKDGISDNQLIGAVITVANGIKASLADNAVDGLVGLAVFFTLALLTLSTSSRLFSNVIQLLPLPHNRYSLQSPRAPPR